MYRNTPDNNEMFRRIDFKNVNYRSRNAITDIAPYGGYETCDGAGYSAPSVMSPLD